MGGFPDTNLVGCTWDFPAIGRCSLIVPTADNLETVERTWTPKRSFDCESRHWDWRQIGRHSRDLLAMTVDGETVAALSSTCADGPVECSVGACYRVDYLEVSPYRYRSGIGLVLLYLIGRRAVECECSNIVVESLPSSCGFYEKLGARPLESPDWNLSELGLHPFYFDADRVALFSRSADAKLVTGRNGPRVLEAT